MNARVDEAVRLVVEMYGHETAHMEPAEQAAAAAQIIIELANTVEEISMENFTVIKGADHGA